jgi:hypothetical protein
MAQFFGPPPLLRPQQFSIAGAGSILAIKIMFHLVVDKMALKKSLGAV